MVALTCLNIMLYVHVHCLSGWVLQYGVSPRRDGFDSGPVLVEFVVDKVRLWQVFFLVLRFPSVIIILAVPLTHSSTWCSYHKDKRAKSGNLPKSSALYKPFVAFSRNSDLQRTSTDKHQLYHIWGPSFRWAARGDTKGQRLSAGQ
jgi:hypothetical protein